MGFLNKIKSTADKASQTAKEAAEKVSETASIALDKASDSFPFLIDVSSGVSDLAFSSITSATIVSMFVLRFWWLFSYAGIPIHGVVGHSLKILLNHLYTFIMNGSFFLFSLIWFAIDNMVFS